MSYKEQLKHRISDLQSRIEEQLNSVDTDQIQLATMRAELAKLNMQDFEEDMRNENTQQLLQG
jgi:hypothetical protein